MSIEAEFIVNLGPYEHVKLTLSGADLTEARDESPSMTFEEWLGDYHASLKAAVLYGRDRALLNAKLAAGIEQAKAGETHDLGDFSQYLEDDPEAAQEGAVELLAEGLGATVLSVEEKPQGLPSRPEKAGSVQDGIVLHVETPSSPSTDRPWKSKPKSKKQQPWEDPITEGPDATPEESVAATKAARKAAAASDWDF